MVALPTAADTIAAAPRTESARSSGHRINRNTRRAYAFRQEHVARQESSVHVLPHAVCRLERTDSVIEPDDDRVSWNGSLSGRQAVLPCTAIQPRTGSVLWWKLLGFTRDRILAKESRRRTGTGSSR
jgi:hypothetical protein